MTGSVDHPAHYNDHPSGVECIDVVEHMSFNVGNAVKYLWRAGLKGDRIEDLEKARWYIDRELRLAERSDEDAGGTTGAGGDSSRIASAGSPPVPAPDSNDPP